MRMRGVFWGAACAVAAWCAGGVAPLRLERVADYPLGVEGASGITYAGGGRFYVVRDHAPEMGGEAALHALDLDFDERTGEIRSQKLGPGVALRGNRDSEGVAFDPATGAVWVSDEEAATVRAFDLAGKPLGREVAMLAIQRAQMVPNRSLEALGLFGDELWTANEEALRCDGALSSPSAGTVVRLMRFTRRGAGDAWRLAGTWPYVCARGAPAFGPSQTGLSGLCALPDGSLLTLEREVSVATWGRCEIYRVPPASFARATDVTGVPALTNAVWTGLAKGPPLVSFAGGRPDAVIAYEGICLGPTLADGARVVCLVSDGGEARCFGLRVHLAARLCVLRLFGLPSSAAAAPPPSPQGTAGGDFSQPAFSAVCGILSADLQGEP